MGFQYWKKWLFIHITVIFVGINAQGANQEDYNVLQNDGSYQFGYSSKDQFHHSEGNRENLVRGEFGSRNPGTGAIDTVSYTAGPRGFRPRGKNIARKYDLSQIGPRPVGTKDDPYFDQNEDPSYNFGFRTNTYQREEAANRFGDVTGRYSYLDDAGERHNVEYLAGKTTGFHVRTVYPDSNPNSQGPLIYQTPGKKNRGRFSIQRGLDGSYKFVSAGPDQRRSETSDATGHVRGSYTFIDDKGVQHTVHYIAGPETGYRVLKNIKAPHLPEWYRFEPSKPSIRPRPGAPPRPIPSLPSLPSIPTSRPPSRPDFTAPSRPSFPTSPDFGGEDYGDKNIEDIFGGPKEHLNTAATGHVKPPSFGTSGEKEERPGPGDSYDEESKPGSTSRPPTIDSQPSRPFGSSTGKPFLDEDTPGFGPGDADDNTFGDDLFKPSSSGESGRPGKEPEPSRPFRPTPDFGGPTTTGRPFSEELPKPLEGGDDNFDLFGGGGGGGGGGGRPPSRPGGIGGFIPTSRPPRPGPGIQRPQRPSFGDEDRVPQPGFGASEERPGAPGGGRDEERPQRPGFGGNVESEEAQRPLFGGSTEDTRPQRPLFGGSSEGETPSRPGFGGGSKEEERPGPRPPFAPGKDDDFGFFDNKGTTPRPGRPSYGTPRPRPGVRPPSRPSYEDKDDNFFGAGPSSTSRPSVRPSYGGSKENDNDGFFETNKGTVSKPSFEGTEDGLSGPINIGASFDGKTTILTNIGDKFISFPPGVAVRAHVQSIDFLPLGARAPSPADQMKSESSSLRKPKKKDIFS